MIKTEKLTKHYGTLTAVDNISFTVSPGEVLGFLGPNGAGTSTTMKMIAGFLTPSAGTASVCGFDVETQPVKAKRSLGYLPEGAPTYGEMTPLQFLRFIADIRGLSGARKTARLDEVIGRLHTACIHTLTVTPPSLDTLFLRSYGDDIQQLETAAANAGEPARARRQ